MAILPPPRRTTANTEQKKSNSSLHCILLLHIRLVVFGIAVVATTLSKPPEPPPNPLPLSPSCHFSSFVFVYSYTRMCWMQFCPSSSLAVLCFMVIITCDGRQVFRAWHFDGNGMLCVPCRGEIGSHTFYTLQSFSLFVHLAQGGRKKKNWIICDVHK